MTGKDNKIIEMMIQKSVEAFILGLEIYNKPTIKYRIEGFSFFICNAWELMLKAELLKRGKNIYYKDNTERTLTLNNVIEQIYTDKNQPLRLNLEEIIKLRNTSTHFVTEDYETVYVPFFQSNILNYSEQIKRFHEVDITHYISQNFLTLSLNMNVLSNDEIRVKYPLEMATKIINDRDNANYLMENNSSNDLFIPLSHQLYITKNINNADTIVAIDNKSETKVTKVKEIINPNDRYKLTYNNIVDAINKRLTAENIPFVGYKGKDFNKHTLQLFINYYNLKENDKYCIKIEFGNNYNFKYSQQIVEFIFDEIKNDPKNIILNIYKAKEKR